jgi:hypothetical protein
MFNDFALKFITVYGEYFHERKRIINMKSSSAAPKCCSREIPFQPLDRVKGDLTCTILQSEIATATIRLNSEVGNLYLRGLLLNNDARKAEAIKIFANALPEFARLIAIKCDVKAGLEQDLVADYLLQTHHSALNMLIIAGSNQLLSFLMLYKREHKMIDIFPLKLPEPGTLKRSLKKPQGEKGWAN